MPLVTIIAPHTGLETASPVSVNGTSYPIAYGKPIELPDEAIDALRNSSLAIVEHEAEDTAAPETETPSPASDPAGNGDAAGAADPGGEAAAGSETPAPADPDFDAEAIIDGTVGDVEARLANLTADQLDAVAKAELDREAPRAGVAKAIEHARKAFANPAE